MQASSFRIRIHALLTAMLLLTVAACATPPSKPDAETEAEIESAGELVNTDPSAAARAFERIAERSRGQWRNDAWLSAMKAWLAANRPNEAMRVHGKLQEPLTDVQQQRRTLNEAEWEVLTQQGRNALLRLESASITDASLHNRLTQVRARALFQLGAVADATLLLDKPSSLTIDANDRYRNLQLIWSGLSSSREPLTDDTLPRDADKSVRAWFELGLIGQRAWQDPHTFVSRLDQWAARYPQHNAQALLNEIKSAHEQRFAYPQKIALLLPMQGRFASSAMAVRDGFLAAYFQLADHRPAPELVIVDTHGTVEGAINALAEARDNGAEFIVGPLTKDELAAVNLASQDRPPTLGLNYLDTEQLASVTPGLYQFGLLPEDEAIQVAERTIAEGRTRATALIPDNDLGNRMLAAFRTRFTQLGGTLLEVERYQSGETDYSTPIMRLLDLDESRFREQNLRATLGQALEYEPRRRQDVQFIFLAANNDAAVLIKPQLRFHQAIDLPVYSTSTVHDPDKRRDQNRDLDDIRFADMPWMLTPDETGAATRRQLASLWPDRFARHGRLYAMGFDAFRLIPLLARSDDALYGNLPAMTGILHMDEFGRIRRELYWAKFAGGLPRLLPDATDKTASQEVIHADGISPAR